MAKNQNKTVENDADVDDFLARLDDETKRQDSHQLISIMQDITGKPPKMWGSSIIGFGNYHYKYPTGREGDFLVVGFSPRKTALTVYIMTGFENTDLMEKLGKYKNGKSCLYIKRLTDIDLDVLKALIAQSVDWMKQRYPHNLDD